MVSCLPITSREFAARSVRDSVANVYAYRVAQLASSFGPIGPPGISGRRRLEAVTEGEEDEEA